MTLVGSARRRTEGDGRRDGEHATVVATNDLPVALVHHPVMAMTQQDEILEVGRSAMDPMHDMMRGAPRRRPVT